MPITTFAKNLFEVLKLVIDIGNTLTKIAVFNNEIITEILGVKSNITASVSSLVSKYGTPESCLISSVKGPTDNIVNGIQQLGIKKVVTIRSGLRLPVKMAYKTPETLGSDRIANACGAVQSYPDQNVLVVDLGTCIKYDLITESGVYMGGGISPGLKMRYKALSSFTGQLPYFKIIPSFPELIGQSTEGSIRSGVENGIIAELDGIIDQYQLTYKSLTTILTGGDNVRFADKLKNTIFVAPNLTLNGLKVILDHNDI
jgi:type III pantothenate kinase